MFLVLDVSYDDAVVAVVVAYDDEEEGGSDGMRTMLL